MAEGDVVLDDRNGSFQNQSEEGRHNFLFPSFLCLLVFSNSSCAISSWRSFFFLSSAHADTVSTLVRLEFRLLVEASSELQIGGMWESPIGVWERSRVAVGQPGVWPEVGRPDCLA